jgi:hypothetical protein
MQVAQFHLLEEKPPQTIERLPRVSCGAGQGISERYNGLSYANETFHRTGMKSNVGICAVEGSDSGGVYIYCLAKGRELDAYGHCHSCELAFDASPDFEAPGHAFHVHWVLGLYQLDVDVILRAILEGDRNA